MGELDFEKFHSYFLEAIIAATHPIQQPLLQSHKRLTTTGKPPRKEGFFITSKTKTRRKPP